MNWNVFHYFMTLGLVLMCFYFLLLCFKLSYSNLDPGGVEEVQHREMLSAPADTAQETTAPGAETSWEEGWLSNRSTDVMVVLCLSALRSSYLAYIRAESPRHAHWLKWFN